MPITKKETKRLRTHTFSEDKVREFGGTYTVAPDFSVSSIIKGSIRLMASKPSIFLLNALFYLCHGIGNVLHVEQVVVQTDTASLSISFLIMGFKDSFGTMSTFKPTSFFM